MVRNQRRSHCPSQCSPISLLCRHSRRKANCLLLSECWVWKRLNLQSVSRPRYRGLKRSRTYWQRCTAAPDLVPSKRSCYCLTERRHCPQAQTAQGARQDTSMPRNEIFHNSPHNSKVVEGLGMTRPSSKVRIYRATSQLCFVSSVDAGRSCPIENVNQIPRVLVQIPLQLALRVEDELGRWIEDACALALILVVEVEYAGRQIE